MRLSDLLHSFATSLADHKDATGSLDTLIESRTTNKIGTVGTLHLYAMEVPAETTFLEDVPVTIVPPGDLEPTGGFLLRRQGDTALVQTLDTLGQSTVDNTLVTDTSEVFSPGFRAISRYGGPPRILRPGAGRSAGAMAGPGAP